MTTVQTNAPSQTLLDNVNGTQKSNTSSVNDIQDRFMTLLVTQMKNQDPLNPMDNAQVTSQMAQLSTVTGIDKLNDTMAALISSVQVGQSYQATSMIGHDVLVSGSNVSTEGAGGYFGVELPVGADKLSIAIKDSAGNTLRNVELGAQSAGTLPLTWDGKTNDGSVAASGDYKIEVTATIGSQAVEVSPLSYAKVLSVSNINGGIKLNLSNNSSVNTTDVKEIF
ncbi:MAG: flagellar hook assembly protein FlgD [Methylophilus sp.]|nr:flagellar hook assembly protein FlgD [Methylophilus sp.]